MGKPQTIHKDSIFSKSISIAQAKDTGMAMVLICLFISIYAKEQNFTTIGALLLICNMVVPSIFKPVATVWLGFSRVIGTVMSRILLTFVFYFIVTPIGLIRRLMGKDSLRLNLWKKDDKSVFLDRDKSFNAEDIETPY